MALPTTQRPLAFDENLGYIRQVQVSGVGGTAQKTQGMAATATTPIGNPNYIGGFDKTGFVRPIGLGSGVMDATTQRITIATDDVIVISLASLENLSKGAGAVLATTLRITQASDSPEVVSLQIMDDWDESDRAKVNPIAGQVGVAANAGAADALTQRTISATNDLAVVNLITVARVIASGGAVTAQRVQGMANAGAAVLGRPVHIGAKAVTFDDAAWPTVTEGDVNPIFNLQSGVLPVNLIYKDGSGAFGDEVGGWIDQSEAAPALDRAQGPVQLLNGTIPSLVEADIGGEIPTLQYNTLELFVAYTDGNETTFDVKTYARHTAGGTDFQTGVWSSADPRIFTADTFRIGANANANKPIVLDVTGTPIVQVKGISSISTVTGTAIIDYVLTNN